jgi:sugar fermentation stimulation protein A
MVFSPNWEMDPDFSEALYRAINEGVKIVAYSFEIILDGEELEIKPYKKVDLKI